MDDKMHYYKFIAGSVIVRRSGDRIEKKGANGVWEDANNLAWRFARDDDALIEITEEEAIKLAELNNKSNKESDS